MMYLFSERLNNIVINPRWHMRDISKGPVRVISRKKKKEKEKGGQQCQCNWGIKDDVE